MVQDQCSDHSASVWRPDELCWLAKQVPDHRYNYAVNVWMRRQWAYCVSTRGCPFCPALCVTVAPRCCWTGRNKENPPVSSKMKVTSFLRSVSGQDVRRGWLFLIGHHGAGCLICPHLSIYCQSCTFLLFLSPDLSDWVHYGWNFCLDYLSNY